MPRFSINLSLLLTEFPLHERFAIAKSHGFNGVEIQFPYNNPANELAELAAAAGVEVVLFNFPAGDPLKGDVGIAGVPGREDEFLRGVELARKYHEGLPAKRINILAGKPPAEVARETAIAVLEKNVRSVVDTFSDRDVTIVLEPANGIDHPNFLLQNTEDAVEIIERVGTNNVMIQFDVYHRQIMQGNLINALRHFLPLIGHIQFADVPGRHEPGTGEINFATIFKSLDELDYNGWVGAEYVPVTSTEKSLGWFQEYRAAIS